MEGRGSGRVEKGDEGYELRLRLKCCTDKEPDLHPALSGDEVYTPSPRRSEGWRGQLFARCSNRTTSKTSILTLNEQRNLRSLYYRYTNAASCSKCFFGFLSRSFCLLRGETNT